MAAPAAAIAPASAAASAPLSRRARRGVEAPAVDEPEAAFHAAVAEPVELAADEFERAARLFAFTGPTPVQVAAAALDQEQSSCTAAATQPRLPRWVSARRRLATASVSIGAMGVVGLLAVGMTTPAAAVAAPADAGSNAASASFSALAPSDDEEIQAFVTSTAAHDVSLNRDESYSTATMADLAADSGVRNFDNSFLNNPNASVQWPFPVGVPYTWGFQMRDGSMHHGVDFVPGAGAGIHAIADGTVRIATEAGGLFGVHVVIDHEIDGELVSSHYAHMEYGSLRVEVGDTVTVGDVLGTVGDTGYSFGAHLHFEVWQNGTTKVDPLEWMREHTAG